MMTLVTPLRLLLSLVAIAAAFGSAHAQETNAPSLTYAMTLHADLGPSQRVAANRIVAPFTGGTLTLADGTTGTVIAPGADWLTVLPTGALALDVRTTVELADGALLYLTYQGRMKTTEAGRAKSAKGETLGPADSYVMTAVTVSTAAEAHAWMNDALFVGRLAASRSAAGGESPFIRYDIYKLAP